MSLPDKGPSFQDHIENSNPIHVITIDGPSGSGKGTISQAVASQLDWRYLESGATYRVIGYLAHKNHISTEDVPRLVALAENLDIEFRDGIVWIGGEEAGDAIRTEEAGKRASLLASIPEVRETLLNWQRSQARAPGLVADGRDMGTVVFPWATCKFYLTASVEVRAQRRFNQLRGKGFDVNVRQLIEDISERDARDVNRAISPLRPADDALLVDTTDLEIHEVVSRVMAGLGNLMPIL